MSILDAGTAADTSNGTRTDPEPPRATHGRAWLQERIDGRVTVVVAIAWFVLMQVAALLEPTTSREVPLVGVVLEIVMYTLLGTMVAGLIMRRRFGLVASLAGAVVATGAAIACPVSGHHAFGVWWFAQMACVLALVGVSVVALRSPRAVR